MAKAKPIKTGLIGAGRAGYGMHLPETSEYPTKFQYVAVCDIDPSRLERFTQKVDCKTYEKAEDLIADPDVEMVDIASRSPEHYEHATAALKAGKHVFLEKPMSMTHAEAKRLQALAEKSEGKLYLRHNRRFDDDFLHIREIIESGKIGDVYEVKLARMNYARRDDWQTLIDCGGGQLLNWGPHIVDHAVQLLDSPVKDIWSDLKLIAAVGDAEDHLKIVLTGENGRIVDLEISGGCAMPHPEYIVLGTKGAIKLEKGKIFLRYLNPRQKFEPREANPGQPGDTFGTPEKLKWVEQELEIKPKKTYNIWDELYKSIRKGTAFPITLDEAVENMRIIDTVKRNTQFAYKPKAKAKTAAKKKTAKKAAKKTAKKAARKAAKK